MAKNDSDPAFDALIEEFVRTGRMPSLDDVDGPARAEAELLLRTAEMVWELGHGAPPLEADPVAAALGLVPDPHTALDMRALKTAMKRARVQASDLSRQLKAREWVVETRDVFTWTTKGAPDASPALIADIATILGAAPAQLTTERRPTEFELTVHEVVKTSAFEALAERWAVVQRLSLAAARATLASRLPVAVNRGEHPDAAQMLASLEELVSSLEVNEHGDQDPR